MSLEKSDKKGCPQCGRELPTNAPEGLCPACLGAMNLMEDTVVTGAGGGDEALPPPPCEEIAAKFPQLEILECLGRGGMGVVYKARQKSLDRLVALKLLAPEKEKDPAFAERFATEAQALARLDHPNIVTIHDFGETDGFFYLLMEFVDGVNLREAMGEGKLEPEQALAIVPPICEALEFAHGRGIVHRDIKPENLLLGKDGKVKIADFGIAKMMERDGGDDEGVVGTPRYMAPEQGESAGRTDHRADIYSLGVVLYEMLTGEVPKNGDMVPPSKRVEVDAKLDEIVLRALESEPGRRYQTAGEFGTRVEAFPSGAATVAAAAPAVVQGGGRWWMPVVANFWWVIALVLTIGKVQARHSPVRYHVFGVGGWMTPAIYGTMVWACVLAGAGFLYWWVRRGGGARGWMPGVGTFWALVTLVLMIGRDAARHSPTRYHFFGSGAWFSPAEYATTVVVCLLLAAGFFVWWWRSGKERKPQTQAVAEGNGGPRISKMAVIGFVWSGLFVITALVSVIGIRVVREGADMGATWWQLGLRFTLLPTGIFAPIGVTLLGWLAVKAIRRSEGRLYGMRLAVFDGLLMPLLVIDCLIAWLIWWLSEIVRRAIERATGGDELSVMQAIFLENQVGIFLLVALVLVIAVDVAIYVAVWRKCRVG